MKPVRPQHFNNADSKNARIERTCFNCYISFLSLSLSSETSHTREDAERICDDRFVLQLWGPPSCGLGCGWTRRCPLKNDGEPAHSRLLFRRHWQRTEAARFKTKKASLWALFFVSLSLLTPRFVRAATKGRAGWMAAKEIGEPSSSLPLYGRNKSRERGRKVRGKGREAGVPTRVLSCAASS